MEFKDLVKNRRIELDLTMEEVGKRVGVSKATVQRWESGEIKNVRRDKIVKLADALSTTPSYLMGWKESNDSDESAIENTEGIKIPVLGRVIAGIPVEAIEDIIDYEEINSQLAKTGEFFALQVRGDSMEPKMSEGDVVIVRKQETCNSGDVAIVLVNGDEATVKRVRILGNGIMLIPFNSKYEPWVYDAKQCEQLPVKIIGKVVELRCKF